MIDSEIHIHCDGEFDGNLCPAEFGIEGYGGPLHPLHVAHQLQQRGWEVRRSPSGLGHLTLCPLHRDPNVAPLGRGEEGASDGPG